MKVIAAILVGGQSSRMGRSKALLELEGKTLVDRTFEILSQCRPVFSEIVISGFLFGRAYISDDKQGAGPVEGIRCVARAFLGRADGLFFVPVDLPFLSTESIEFLVSNFEFLNVGGVSFVDHPLPALFRLDDRLVDACNNCSSVNEVLKAVQASAVPVTDEKFLTNINTPGDWARATGVVL